ncbi:SDR family NAD(P)-dependent oxidoreductase [Chloroflexota bacterium]
MKLEGKVTLVTGAGSGIGEATALLFAGEGADIAVNDINPDTAERTAEAVRKTGRKALVVVADVADASQVNNMVDTVVEKLGGIHILINNAGIPVHGPMLENQTPEAWDKVVGVIMRGTYLCSRAAGKWMVENQTGNIVNISSIAGSKASTNIAGYGAAKAAVIQLTKTLAVDWGKHGVRVNCIAPGIINTPLTQSTIAAWQTPEQIAQRIPIGEMGESEDIAKAALFLVSNDARHITGINLPVDGGMAASGA